MTIMFRPPAVPSQSFRALRVRLADLGYLLRRRRANCYGQVHAYGTTPLEGSGPSGFFTDLAAVEQYAHNVAWVRDLEASLPPIAWPEEGG